MLGFLKCVAEAAVENGLQGLLALVPGGPYAYAVGGAALKKYRERKKDAEQRAEIQQLAEATFEQARVEAVEAVRQVLAEKNLTPPPEAVVALELWLASVPEATRVSLKRKDDPSGRSLPDGFVLRDADDVVKLLPPRPPKFTPGAALPGKPGWVLDRLLGVGGFGEVWFARNAKMASLTGAVKFCHGEQARDLQHEAGVIDRLMATGRHPNIVPLTDVNLEGDMPWLMYEYVAGGTLADWVHTLQGMTAERRQVQILAALKQLVDAVGFFHRLDPPIVHRDLKPANILLNKANKKLQITDFGIGAVTAKATLVAESRGQSTHGGRLLTYMRGSHTPLYASPQQKVGADPDPRDDVHALGVIAYQMFIGNLATGPGRDMDDDLRDNGAGEGLIDLLGKCVAQRAERRPNDAGELGIRLNALGRTEDVSPPVVPPASVASPPVVAVKPPEMVHTPVPAAPVVLPSPVESVKENKELSPVPVGRSERVALSPEPVPYEEDSFRGAGADDELRKPPTGQGKPNRRVALGLVAAGVAGLGAIYRFWPTRGREDTRGREEGPVLREEKLTPKPGDPKSGGMVEFPLPGGLKMTFCWIPAGTATLGSPGSEQERSDDEKEHSYTTKGFWLGKYPVTQAEWQALTGNNPSHFTKGAGGADKVKGLDTSRFPVESVSWDMICGSGGLLEMLNAVGGVEKVFGKVGKFALPHEDAWEYACRGGLGNKRPFYWGNELNGTQANMDGNYPFGTSTKGPYLGRPTPVGSYAAKFPHPWGLCDMHGNVFEWCENLYEQTTARVLRGGSWGSCGLYCRAAFRYRNVPDYLKFRYSGFRLFLPLDL